MVIVVIVPAGTHCTASVVPTSLPLMVTWAVPAVSVPGAGFAAGGGSDEQLAVPATSIAAAATNSLRITGIYGGSPGCGRRLVEYTSWQSRLSVSKRSFLGGSGARVSSAHRTVTSTPPPSSLSAPKPP